MTIDLHTHHHRCGHASGDLEAYVRAALERGLGVIGLSDHAPLLLAGAGDDPAPGMHMPRSAWEGYLREASEIRRRYEGRIDVLVGVEADYLPGREDAYAALLDDPRLDYVIGSVHYVDGLHVYDRSRWQRTDDVEGLDRRYAELVRAAAATGRYDVMAHVDAMKARAPRPVRDPGSTWGETVDAIAAAGVAVEINTSGYRKGDDPFPAWGLVERLHAAGVPLTFGSDAHDVGEVGFAWSRVRGGLRERGVDALYVPARGRAAARRVDVAPEGRGVAPAAVGGGAAPGDVPS